MIYKGVCVVIGVRCEVKVEMLCLRLNKEFLLSYEAVHNNA